MSLKEQIEKQRDDYLSTYPDKGIAQIVAEHLNTVLGLLQKELPYKLDILAELLFDYVGDEAFSVTWFRELLQRWMEKEILKE